MSANQKKPLRSTAWFGHPDRDGFLHRSWMKNQGFPADLFDGRPVIGICNTYSELTPCNAHFRELAERVKRGVYEAGGFPLEFPVFSNGESNLRPTAMLFRNLASMDVEEAIRGNPVDGVVLMTGCDKTTPALLMGAASCDVPAIVLSGGPMLNGKFRGKDIGSGTDVWRFAEEVKAGEMSLADFMDAEACMSRSVGHCNVMGTASTMNSMAEALGMSLPGCAAIPAADSRRRVIAQLTGRRIVEMVHEDLRILEDPHAREFSQRGPRERRARRLDQRGDPPAGDRRPRRRRVRPRRLGPLRPRDPDARRHHAVRPFSHGGLLLRGRPAGGDPHARRARPARQGRADRHRPAMWDNVKDAPNWNTEVIRTFDNPLTAHGGIAVLRGNLAPDGAVLKPSAATPALMSHRGRAVVFENIEDYKAKINDDSLDVDETCILVLKNCGPKGYPGMSEVGNMGLPPKVLRKGVRDMVRISDARMSGTAYGTVVLHVCPEAAAGGTLALVENGDVIELDVAARRLHLEVGEDELARRRERWRPPAPAMTSGYQKLYVDTVLQASQGADLDFLRGCRGAAIPRESH